MEARDDAGRTPVIAAARPRGSMMSMMLEALLRAAVHQEARDHDGQVEATAVEAKSSEILSALQFHEGDSWLPAAAGNVVRELLAAGADPRVRDAQGATALMHAAGYGGNLEVLELLVEAGIDPDTQDDAGRSALMWAAEFAATAEVVGTLLDLGADPSLANHAGETAWDLIQDNEALQDTSGYHRLRSVLSGQL